MSNKECNNCVDYNKQIDESIPEKVHFSGSTIIIDRQHRQAYKSFKEKPYYMRTSK